MSAWLCENGTLSLVVDVIKSDSFRKYYDVNREYCDKSEEELIHLLSDINTTNLHYLYESFPSGVEQSIMDNLGYVELDVSNAQRHMSVCSFIYQSCDCDENSGNMLYLLLRKWREDYYKIYSDEHDTCEWDIDCPLDSIGGC